MTSREGQTKWPAVLLGIVVGMGLALAVHCETHLEYAPPPWHDTSSNPTADPYVKRVHGATILRWRGAEYLFGASQLEVFKAEIRSTGLAPLSWSNFGVPPYGDRDLNLFNFTVCDDCRYAAAGYDVQGLVIWDMGTGPSPLLGDSRRWTDAGTAGAFTFSYGTRQYLVARVHPDCQGDALVEVTGIRPEDMRLVQCVVNGSGQPYTVDGGFWLPNDPQPGDPITGWVWLLDRQLAERVHAYTVRTVSGDPHLEAVGWTIRAGWLVAPGIAVDLGRAIAVSAYSDGLSVWDIHDPVAPVRLSLTPLWNGVRSWGVALRWPYVWAGILNSVDIGATSLWDISDPAHPELVDPDYWMGTPPPCEQGSVVPPGSTHPWNEYPCSGNAGAAWSGDTLWMSRKSVGLRHDLHIEANPALVFADGFESGDTGGWR